MQAFLRRLIAVSALAALLALSGSVAGARTEAEAGKQLSVVLVLQGGVGCPDPVLRIVCDGFRRAVRLTGVRGRIITPTLREDPVDTLELAAKQRHDLVVVLWFGSNAALGEAARRQRGTRFAILDGSRSAVAGRPRNVQGVMFRTSEAAFLAGWLAARLEQRRSGRDVVGVVGGFSFQPVVDFVIGFRAGARRASPGIRVLTTYSNDFDDPSKCKAIARRQIARGAGAVFNVAGGCGLGTLEAAGEAGVWGIGVDTDQSYLGKHILTSVVKRYDAGFLTLLRQLKAGRLRTGGDTVLTLREDAVGLGRVSPRVPAALRAELDRLRGRVATGDVRVPGAFPDPR